MSSREYLAIRTHPRITICPTNEFHPAISLNLKREDLYRRNSAAIGISKEKTKKQARTPKPNQPIITFFKS